MSEKQGNKKGKTQGSSSKKEPVASNMTEALTVNDVLKLESELVVAATDDDDKDLSKRLGENIRFHRTKRNFSTEYFAELVNLSSSYVGLLERGVRRPSLKKLVHIAGIFGLNIDELIFGNDEDNGSGLKVAELDEDYDIYRKREVINALLPALNSFEYDFVIETIKNILRLRKAGAKSLTAEGLDDLIDETE